MITEKKIFIISPAYNEEGSLSLFVDEVVKTAPLLTGKISLVIVDDGSKDQTLKVMKRIITENKHKIEITCVELSRNWGHQSAMMAGLEYAYQKSGKGALFIIMDSDLEHPPHLIPQIEKLMINPEIDHLQLIRRDLNRNLSFFKSTTSKIYYSLFRFCSGMNLSEGSADFRCMKRNFLKSFLELPESDRFNRGLFHWIGFKTIYFEYDVGKRLAGESKYSLRKMIELALKGITSFSGKPLTLFNIVSVVFSFTFSVAYLLYELYHHFYNSVDFQPGWLTIVASIFFWGGILSFGQLLQAVYVSKMFNEIKRRPNFIVRQIHENKVNK